MKTAVTVIVLVGLLALAVWGGMWAWNEMGEVQISARGMVAMIAGILFSLALGGGLMFLVFWSNRRGHDDLDRR